jgi:hypothetical protein
MKHFISSVLCILLIPCLSLSAQSTKEEVMSNILVTGGTYYSYPMPTKAQTPPPVGYKPFYISHYGRHGSRYMADNRPYAYTIAKLDSAEKDQVITALGKEVLRKLKIAYQDAYLRDGDLSKLGARQHQGIAERMYHNYPEIFSKPIHVDARASVVLRCTLSMSNFCKQLRGLNPKLNIAMDASQRDMWYIANGRDDSIKSTPGDKVMSKRITDFKNQMIQPDRMMSLLFNDSSYVRKNIDSGRMMKDLFDIAQDMQCQPELHLSFFDLFTKEELFDIWQTRLASWCLWAGLFPSTSPRYLTHLTLLRNILDTADKVIKSGETTATLRFGHDSVVIPLAYLLHLKGCDDVTENLNTLYQHWCDYKVSPMAGNIQLVFYRNSKKDILVKFLHNEMETSIPVKTDCAPYYHWKDVETFYRTEIANKTKGATTSTPRPADYSLIN